MKYVNINEIEPSKDYMRCLVKTNLNREFEVDYYDEYGIFFTDDDGEIGWKGKNELVIYWKEIE